MRKVKFVNEEYYHIFNRGVDKRTIFEQKQDLDRFFQSMDEFNVIEPIGSIYSNNLNKNKKLRSSAPQKLVEFICYCLNQNHYHFILKQLVDNGIKNFMHKLSTGYTNYFNQKYKRRGSLFQGRFQAIHVDSNEYLLHLSSYVNLNYKVHNLEKFRSSAPKLMQSSWKEYIGDGGDDKDGKVFCNKNIILDQFGSVLDYKKFTEDSLKRIKENKEIEKFLLE